MVEIVADGFKLRPFKPEDVQPFHLAINTSQIDRDTTIPLPWDADSIDWWIGFITDAAARVPVTEQHFVIEVNGEFSGSIGIINLDGHKAEIGYWLKEDCSGKGIMTKTVALISEYAFKNMNLKRLFAPILTHNKASAKILENNNYKMEGVLKSFYFKHGRYEDALCYAKVDD